MRIILPLQRKEGRGRQQQNARQQHMMEDVPHRFSIPLTNSSPHTKNEKSGIKCPIIIARSSTKRPTHISLVFIELIGCMLLCQNLLAVKRDWSDQQCVSFHPH